MPLSRRWSSITLLPFGRPAQAGVKLAISSDAHSTRGFGGIRFGVDQARRGWLEAGDVINTRSLAQLRKLSKR
jgi:DNA polymerase (family 10)